MDALERRQRRRDAENKRRINKGLPPLGKHGGRRVPGQRLGKPNGDAIKTTAPAEAAKPQVNRSLIAALVEVMQSRSAAQMRPRSEEWNPYKIRPELFGPVATHIRDKRPKLAMDQNGTLMNQNAVVVQAWQAGGLLGAAVSEGLLFLGYPYLSQLAQRPEFRLFGEIRAQEMTRKWTEFRGTKDESTKSSKDDRTANRDDEDRNQQRKATGEKPRSDARNKEIENKIKELKDLEDELKVKSWFRDSAAQDDFFGISHLYLDMKGVDPNDMRDPELKSDIGNGRDKKTRAKFKGVKNFIRGLRTIEPIWVYPTTYNAVNPLINTWYDPQVWYVMGTEIHKSRLLTFISRPVPDILRPAYAFGGLAMTQMAQPYVDIWLRTRESVGQIIHAFSVMVLATNLATTTMPGGSGGGAGDVMARMNLANMLRDNQGMQLIDKDTEDFFNIAAPISGLSDLQAQSQEHLCSVGRIPVVKYTGVQPMGLNATAEGELTAFYDTVAGEQEHLYRPNLTTVYDLMQYNLWGDRDPDITYDFLPLRESTEKEKAEIRKANSEADQILVDGGAISQEEWRRKIAADPDSGFDSIDPEDVPDLLEEEMGGLIPAGSGRGLQAELEEGGGQQTAKPKKPEGQDDGPTPEEARRQRRVTSGKTADGTGRRRRKVG